MKLLSKSGPRQMPEKPDLKKIFSVDSGSLSQPILYALYCFFRTLVKISCEEQCAVLRIFFFPGMNTVRTSATEANADFILHLQDTLLGCSGKQGQKTVIERRVNCES